MSKLSVSGRPSRAYDQATIQDILRQVEQQANALSEGRIVARYGALTAAPTSGSWARGDLVDNSAPAVVSDDVADYIIVGWICTVSGTPGTWKERRVLVEGITADLTEAKPQLGTEQDVSTGEVAYDFTGIPSWVKKIIIELFGVSTSGTSPPLIQIGDAGDIEATGYSGAASNLSTAVATANYTTGFGLVQAHADTVVLHGTVTLTLEDSAAFTWIASGVLTRSDAAATNVCGGSKSLSAALDRVRITTVGGTDTFDAGSINVLYE